MTSSKLHFIIWSVSLLISFNLKAQYDTNYMLNPNLEDYFFQDCNNPPPSWSLDSIDWVFNHTGLVRYGNCNNYGDSNGWITPYSGSGALGMEGSNRYPTTWISTLSTGGIWIAIDRKLTIGIPTKFSFAMMIDSVAKQNGTYTSDTSYRHCFDVALDFFDVTIFATGIDGQYLICDTPDVLLDGDSVPFGGYQVFEFT
ncbi:MAG: hypothetical protein N4A45_09520, partial [Flavobacteriales bacterium]|nr:hypothetical protein [Flavobacteriales bacterium]